MFIEQFSFLRIVTLIHTYSQKTTNALTHQPLLRPTIGGANYTKNIMTYWISGLNISIDILVRKFQAVFPYISS